VENRFSDYESKLQGCSEAHVWFSNTTFVKKIIIIIGCPGKLHTTQSDNCIAFDDHLYEMQICGKTWSSFWFTPSAGEVLRTFFVSFLESLSMRNDSRCLSNSCQKNSTCITGHRDDICRCVDMSLDTMEELCNKTSDPCSSNPCLQNATCLSSAGNLNFTCECPDGYNGTTCEIAISMCDTNPCEHGGTCLDGLARPTCLCRTGFTGTRCEMDVDECSSEPCHNGAVCRDGIDEYSCYCVPGYQGKHCDLEVNECVSDPCLNGATCLNLIGRYYCICPLGYTGKHWFKQPFLCVMENYSYTNAHTHLVIPILLHGLQPQHQQLLVQYVLHLIIFD